MKFSPSFSKTKESFILTVNYCANLTTNPVISTAKRLNKYNSLDYRGLIWLNNKTYEIQALCFSHNYREEVLYLTELKDDFNPLFNIFTKNTNFSSNISAINTSFASHVEAFLSLQGLNEINKKRMLSLWVENSSYIKNNTFKERLEIKLQTKVACTTGHLNKFVELAIVDSFDKIFNANNISEEQINVFVDDLLTNQYIIIMNIPLLYNLLNHKDIVTLFGTRYKFSLYDMSNNQRCTQILQETYIEYKEEKKSILSDNLVTKISRNPADISIDRRISVADRDLQYLIKYIFNS